MDLRSATDAALEARLQILKGERSRSLSAMRGYRYVHREKSEQAKLISTELAARSAKGTPTPYVKDGMVFYNLARVVACRFQLPSGDWILRGGSRGGSNAYDYMFDMYYLPRMLEIGALARSFGATVDPVRRIISCDNMLLSLELMARGAQFKSLSRDHELKSGKTRASVARSLRHIYAACYIDRETNDTKETRHREQQGDYQDSAD